MKLKGIWRLSCAAVFAAGAVTASAADDEAVIVRCESDCGKVANKVRSLGGTVRYEYKYVDAIAADLPRDKSAQLSQVNGVRAVYKDLMVERPSAVHEIDVAGEGELTAEQAGEIEGNLPDDYLFNLELMGSDELLAQGYSGDGVIVAIIDTGTAPVSSFNRAGCAAPGPTVLGGETFIGSADPTEPPATSFANGNHGTWVGTTMSANTLLLFGNGGAIVPALNAYAPDSVFPFSATQSIVPMIGPAPCAQIYALKTFKAAGGGAPTSDIVAAMERAIELKENYDAGVPANPSPAGCGAADNPCVYDALNIQVVNMSLGGPTLYAGYDLDDLLTVKMLDVGITVINSAGNEGHAAMTGGSAGTGFGTITSGAASTAAHERILRDIQFGTGIGGLYRPSDETQMATFSSRGPSSDGRVSVNNVANGFAVLVENANDLCCSLVSGTSFSAPNTAGVVAQVRQAMPGASAAQLRNAMIQSADPSILAASATPFDQGEGFVDGPAALALLQSGSVDEDLERGPEGAKVKGNISSLGVKVINLGNGGTYETTLSDLIPGQVAHFFVETKKGTRALEVTLSNIEPELPPAQQNAFFGDDVFLKIQDARTSDEDNLLPFPGGDAFVNSDTTFVVTPEEGIVRLGVMGDWTNAGKISTDVTIREVRGPLPGKPTNDRVAEGDSDVYAVDVPAGAASATFHLRWNNNWGAYPTDDLDLIILDPAGGVIFSGATLSSPEVVEIANPAAGTWTVIVDGFTVWGVRRGGSSPYQLRVFDEAGDSLL